MKKPIIGMIPLVEVVWLPGKKCAFAVHWHPEFFPAEDEISGKLFRLLVSAAE